MTDDNLELKIKELYHKIDSPLPEYNPAKSKNKETLVKMAKYLMIGGVIAISGLLGVKYISEKNEKIVPHKIESNKTVDSSNNQLNESNNYNAPPEYYLITMEQLNNIDNTKNEEFYKTKIELDKINSEIKNYNFKNKSIVEQKIKELYAKGENIDITFSNLILAELMKIRICMSKCRYRSAEQTYISLLRLMQDRNFAYLDFDMYKIDKNLRKEYLTTIKPKIDDMNKFESNIESRLIEIEKLIKIRRSFIEGNNKNGYNEQEIFAKCNESKQWLKSTLQLFYSFPYSEDIILEEKIKKYLDYIEGKTDERILLDAIKLIDDTTNQWNNIKQNEMQ